MRPNNLHLLVGGMLFLLLLGDSSAATNTTTPAPDITPTPSAGMPLRLSFVIDGVVYVMQCNFSGLNMSNCTFATDHGLTVSPLSASGSTEIPEYLTAIVATTFALVVILTAMAAYLVWSRSTGMTGQGYTQVQPNAPPPPQAPPQNPQYQTPGAWDPGMYRGNTSRAGGRPKIISVNLVQPCLPSEAMMP